MNGKTAVTGCALLAALSLGFATLHRVDVSVAATPQSVGHSQAVPTAGGWTFQGCWTPFSAGTCYDIYTDPSGNHWKCKACGTTKNPGPNKCQPISSATLAAGRWCS